MKDKMLYMFHEDWLKFISLLPDGMAVQIFRAISSRYLGEEYEIKDHAMKAYFNAMIDPDIDVKMAIFESELE